MGAKGWRWLVPVVAAAVAVSATACGLGDKQAIADRLHASRQAVADASPAAGTLQLEIEADDDAGGQSRTEDLAAAASALAGATAGATSMTLQVSLDGDTRRARTTIEDPNVERAAVFDDTQVFVRRQNARATERRTWARLDLARLVEDERSIASGDLDSSQVLSAVAATLNPAYLVDLVEGVLAGSVARRGTESAGGVETTRYDANISFDKALTELDFDDEQREDRLRLFHLLGSRKDVLPASIWLDAEGRLRKLRIEFDQMVDRRRTDTLIAALELTSFGADADLDHPAEEATVTYERFGRLVRSALPAQA